MPSAKLEARPSPGVLRRFSRDETGIAVTEYGLLIALVAILLISVVTLFASEIASWFSAKTAQITSV
jgi:Flp pilus assembly pilin Flp